MADKARKPHANGVETRERIMKYLRRYIRKHGYAPSQREIAQALHYSEATIQYQMTVLKREGLLTFERGRTRTIRLTEAA